MTEAQTHKKQLERTVIRRHVRVGQRGAPPLN